jgi:glycosyltransferase involved in cell wall biosynthesis
MQNVLHAPPCVRNSQPATFTVPETKINHAILQGVLMKPSARSSERQVSVVIPTYNGAAFIAETLSSVLCQSTLPLEILVIDDCSTDHTLEVIESISKKSVIPFRIKRLDSNSGGPARPMNEGIRMAEGPFIAMLDQDDLLAPQRLELSLRALSKHCDASMVCGNYYFINENGASIEGTNSVEKFHFLNPSCFPEDDMIRCEGDIWLQRFFQQAGLQRSCSNHFFRKTVWEKVGGYDEEAQLASDYDFFIRCFSFGVVWVEPLVFIKREHSRNSWVNNQESDIQLAILQDRLVETIQHPKLAIWRNEMLLQRIRMARWKGRYNLSRSHSLRLLKHGVVFDSIKEILKTSLLEPVDAIRSLIKTRQ